MIEVNADIGEGCDDVSLIPYLGRVSIACGGHAGDGASMVAALQLAEAYGVPAGAHPSYPDRARFGRHPWAATGVEISAWVTQQTEALAELAARRGSRLAHVKPHGALYNVAAVNPVVASAIAEAIAGFDSRLALIGLSGSALIAAGEAAGLAVLNEAFADRRYQLDGQLVSRETAGALVLDPEKAAGQAGAIANGEPIAVDGGLLTIRADTLCLHSDTQGALKIARAVQARLYRG